MRFIWTCALTAGLAACATAQPGASTAGADAQTLQAYHWQLREVRDAQGQPQPGWTLPPAAPAMPAANGPQAARAVLLNFDGKQITVGRLCNALAAGYSLQDSGLQVGPVRGTLMACQDSAAMALEQQVGQRLPQASQWRIAPAAATASTASTPVLTLVFTDGGQWVLDGAPTDAARYGNAGERMFLEVAPQRVQCSHPLIPDYRCLQVRTVEYDGQGLKTHIGAWQNWYAGIEGYTHQPGVRNVLRIQRYPQAQPPADAPAYVYVLDMTVESEIVR